MIGLFLNAFSFFVFNNFLNVKISFSLYFSTLFRERTSETEREIGRQRQLEVERGKTRELQFNVDMEREKQTQVQILISDPVIK